MVTEEAFRGVLDKWRRSLIGITRSSSLVKFRTHRKQALAFNAPEPDEILALLRDGTEFIVRGVVPVPEADEPATLAEPGDDDIPHSDGGEVERFADDRNVNDDARDDPEEFTLPAGHALLHTPAKDDQVPGTLRNLRKAAEEAFLDRGVSILYLAFGLLHWEAEDGTELCSPLLMAPVKLQAKSAHAVPTLVEGDDDEVLNPALKLLLEERGAVLDHLPSPEDVTASEVISEFEMLLGTVEGLGEWRIENAVHLGKFTFTKEAMYRDLIENEERVLAHPLVRALATTDPTVQTDEFLFDGIAPSDVDRLAPEEATPLVLDADSSQRAAIAAARSGKSFVMDGPPGTGKSQTIANMVGTLIHDGKTVLFVSEKAAALDVVRNRLEKVGLGSFLFDIHSAKSGRRAVAQELARTLENKVVPPKELDDVSRATLVEKRQSLNDYAQASNEMREPLRRSFHDSVGRLAQLEELPLAPTMWASVRDLTERQFASLLDSARQISRSWRPATEGSAFIWRGVTTDRPLYRELDEARRHLERAEIAAAPHRQLLTRLALDSPEKYVNLPGVLEHRDAIHDRALLAQWLTAASLDPYRSARVTMVVEADALQEAESALGKVTESRSAEFPPLEQIPPKPLAENGVAKFDLPSMDAATLEQTADLYLARAESLSEAQRSLQTVARGLGLPVPDTCVEAERMMQLAQLREHNSFPDPRWFSQAELHRVRQITDEIDRQHQYVVQMAATATQWFTSGALTLPLRDLQRRFAVVYTGFGARFSSEYKADKRLIVSALQDPSGFKEAVHHLDAAIEWADAEQYMKELVAARAGALGHFWRGPRTDYRALRTALTTVDQALSVLPKGIPRETATYLSGEGDHRESRALLDSARQSVCDWQRVCTSEEGPGLDPSMLEQPFQHSTDRLRKAAIQMTRAAERVRWVSGTTGKSHALPEAEKIVDAVARVRSNEQVIEQNEPEYRERFGSLARNAEALDSGLDHAQSIRDIAGGPLDEESVSLFLNAGTVADLKRSAGSWLEQREALLQYFEEERREELREDLGSLEDSLGMIAAWRADATGQQEWSDHKRHRDQLTAYGLEAAIEFCAQQRVEPGQVESIIEKTVLQAWVEDVLDVDDRLRPLTSADKDSLVAEYKELDLQLIQHTAGRIIRAANSRRPALSGIGETGLLRKEGARKRKHLPSRELIGHARGAAQSLKPVFMMSPLAVSQYLPADMTFDVVIFDEASQVLPADAVNSIYRGRALILAGDDKQLPPSTFFERAIEEEEEKDDAEEQGVEGVGDYGSVLELAKGSGAFPGLGLRWHYRSQHESLIAYSNYKFYEGKLITFPSALKHGDDIGVSFRKVDGLYERGGSASNPGEALSVAHRVIRHYTEHPELTLGVVTFSVAQKAAIESALFEERRRYPELEKYFETEDRLGGFFVRSLESVQGDERDVIFFSVGYGPDEAGKVGTSFGVLNRKGGWRRLNVGITRARRAVEVFASMEPTQIPFSTNENVEYLRGYLEYAAKGMQSLAVPPSPTGLDPESPFEESVIKTIRGWGYEVEPQVGAAGYRIDLGVKHPELPGKFALGVECDGYQYHSAPAARDRDRLRDSVLTGLGWTMHRIWGTAWYRHRAQEEARLKDAIETAALDPNAAKGPQPVPKFEHPEVLTEVVDPAELPIWMHPYAAADPSPLPWGADPGDQDSVPLVRRALLALVEAEGPVHHKVVEARLRQWWGIGRIRRRIRQNIDEAVKRSPIQWSGDFMYTGALDVEHVRAPSVEAARSVNEVHPRELALAVAFVVRDAGFAEHGEVVRQVRQSFGWNRTGDQIAHSLGGAIEAAVENGWVDEEDGQLVPPARQVG